MPEARESRTTHQFRQRVVAILNGCVVASLVAALLVALLVDLPQRRAASARRRVEAAQAATVAADLIVNAGRKGGQRPEDLLRVLRDAIPGAVRVCVLQQDARKRWVYRLDLSRDRTRGAQAGSACRPAEVLAAVMREPVVRESDGLLWAFAPVRGVESPALAALALETSEPGEGSYLLGWGLVIAPMLALLFMPLVTHLLSTRVTRPIDNLIEAAGRVQFGDFDTAVDHRDEDELAHLSRAFNAMVASLRNDTLTGLGNARYLEERLAQEVARALDREDPLSLLLVDIDELDRIVRLYGRETGDGVICMVGRILGRTVRALDWVARCGESDFAVVLPGTNVEGAMVAAHRLRNRIEREFGVALSPREHHDEYEPPSGITELMLTVSIGVAGCPSDAESAESLLAAAALAVGRAKHLTGAIVVAYNSFSSHLGGAGPVAALREARVSGLDMLIQAAKE